MPLMTAAQTAAFNSANSSAGEASTVYALVAGCMVVAAFLWFGWVTISAYRSLNSGSSIPDASTKVVRAFFILILVIFLGAV